MQFTKHLRLPGQPITVDAWAQEMAVAQQFLDFSKLMVLQITMGDVMRIECANGWAEYALTRNQPPEPHFARLIAHGGDAPVADTAGQTA